MFKVLPIQTKEEQKNIRIDKYLMEELQTHKGISGSTLKLIAVITMVIDHVGAVVLARLIMASGYMSAIYSSDVICPSATYVSPFSQLAVSSGFKRERMEWSTTSKIISPRSVGVIVCVFLFSARYLI